MNEKVWIMGFIAWIKQLFSSQSRTTVTSDKEGTRISDEEKKAIEEFVVLDIIRRL